MAQGKVAAFDEMHGADGDVREPYVEIARWLRATPREHLDRKRREAELLFRRIGITFAVYGEGGDPERLIPFDLIPRILARSEWDRLAAGLRQRVRALNAFLADVYGKREILRAGRVPEALVLSNPLYRAEMRDFAPPGGIYTHVCGIDVVRTGPDSFYVLEDNARTPSGVSYMLENREAMLRLFPRLCARHRMAPIGTYTEDLLATLKAAAPPACRGEPTVALLTPGPFNSAYYEHSFLADDMGVELVEGADLGVQDRVVYMRTTAGPRRVDVIYRRIDDEYLDPECFLPDSMLGVPGLMAAYRAGNVALANAPGCGVADDKAIYPYVPEMVRFYLGEEPLVENVPTHLCGREEDRKYVLSNLDTLVVKLTKGSGGYGMMVGPHATREEREEFRARILARPGDYIAQPTLALSTCPTVADQGIAGRHVDLRPFVLSTAKEIRIVPGGLTRVALKEGSLVVNSSQGGGTKDTWVLDDAPAAAMTQATGGMTQGTGGGTSQSMGGMTQTMGPLRQTLGGDGAGGAADAC